MKLKQALETDLIAGFAAAMTLDEVRKRNLGAWAYYTASADSPFRRDCAADFGRGWARFQSMLPALEELLSAWHRAQIDVTVFKGFAMAQCVYPHTALRYFGDVDLYVPPTQIPAALAAMPAGWRHASVFSASHEAGYLRPANRSVAIDLHCAFFPAVDFRKPRFERMTRQLLERRFPIACGPAATVQSLQLVDLALIGLAVNRGWGGENWRLKPHDYLDLHYLRERGVSEKDIEDRARDLGLMRTWQSYALICNPYRSRLDFSHSRRSGFTRLRNDLRILPEICLPPRELRRWLHAPAIALEMIAVLPTLLKVIAQTRRAADEPAVVVPERWPAQHIKSHLDIARGMRWAMRLLAPFLKRHPAAGGVIRSIAAYRLFAMQGIKADWVLGVCGIAEGNPRRYAWVEVGGAPAEGFSDEAAPSIYREITRIPAPASLALQTKNSEGSDR
jgi:hypothetical protein